MPLPDITMVEIIAIHLVLFGMQNRTFLRFLPQKNKLNFNLSFMLCFFKKIDLSK
jgi:hypothetical protein